MDRLDRKVDGRAMLREQCYVCWMTPTDVPPPAAQSAADVRSAHQAGKIAMGVILLATGFLVLTGLDKVLEARLVELSPAWLTELTTRY